MSVRSGLLAPHRALETLRRLRRAHDDVIVSMVTSFASIDLAVDAMKIGATAIEQRYDLTATMTATIAISPQPTQRLSAARVQPK